MPTAIVAYLALFATVAFLFVLACLLLGRLLRSCAPSAEKLATYECGEPAVGSGRVQFDLRFYVVALVFLIFEVEVALFFPPAVVFGQAARVSATSQATETNLAASVGPTAEKTVLTPFSAATLARVAMVDLGLFFAVLLVGFAYVWRRGDLDWVRAIPPRAAGVALPLQAGGRQ